MEIPEKRAMDTDSPIEKAVEEFKEWSPDDQEFGRIVFIVSDDPDLSEEFVRAISRDDPSTELPVYRLNGAEYEDHLPLFSAEERELKGELVPRDKKLILFVSNFDQIPEGHQIGYGKSLVDEFHTSHRLAPGSILVFQISTNHYGKVEGRVADLGPYLQLSKPA